MSTDWAGIVRPRRAAAAPPLRASAPVEGEEIYLVPGLFSPRECAALVRAAESFGFGATSYPKEYRGNLRLTTRDPALAAAAWARLAPLVPPTVWENGRLFQAVGLNPLWRLAKYHPGDRFAPHVDAFFEDRHAKSMFTVNVYMNEGFDGGKTSFLFDDRPRLDVTPRTGLCLLFRQPHAAQYVHEGERLGSGLKYLFRTDVMYRRVAA